MAVKEFTNKEIKHEIEKVLGSSSIIDESFKEQLTKDNLLSIQIKRYIKFKETEEYSEEYKLEVLSKLNSELENMKPIDEDNIFDVITLFQRENPSKGSLAHWTGLDNLKKYAETNIKEACEKWNKLLDDNLSVIERINSFIEIKNEEQNAFRSKFDTRFTVGLDTAAYILAGFDFKKYPVYKFGIYKNFTELYELERIKSDYGKIYDHYLKLTKIIADVFNKLGYLKDANVQDSQDFIYCVVSYDSLKLESLVEYLHSISLELGKFKNDNKLFIDYINNLDRNYFKKFVERYADSVNINGIRENVARYLYNGNKLTIDKYEDIKNKEADKHEKNILRAWSDLGILLPFYYENFKARVSNAQDNIIEIIKNIDPLFNNYNSHKVGFEGTANYGGTRCWLAVYPKEKDSHQDSKQLFISIITEDEILPYIEYGFIPGSKLENPPEMDIDIVELNEFKYSNMVEKLKEVYEKYFEDRTKATTDKIDKAYFVGAVLEGVDFFEEFIEKGTWKTGYSTKFADVINNIQVGDKIAIKSTYTRKNDLPFDNKDEFVSVMGIKALGTVKKNSKDGKSLEVDWKRLEPLKEWYFFTGRGTIWEIERQQEDWRCGALIDFAFKNEKQDIDKFLEHPFWNKKYGLDSDEFISEDGEDYKVDYADVDFDLPINLDSLYFEDKDILKKQISLALKSGKSIILIGPPGTGKSKLAQSITDSYQVESKMVTAMSDWSSYDTIGGYKPDSEGALYFEDGIFLSTLKDKKGNNINKWLIIDEINRADIDKAFGPFFSALSGDDIELGLKDDVGNNIELLLEKNLEENIQVKSSQYIIPKDWRIIGTMNTFDKTSLYEMSYAFMRRFAFIPVAIPKTINSKLVSDLSNIWEIDLDEEDYESIFILWETINDYRKVGPALIEDIARFVELNGDYTSSIIIYILPQLEGIFDDKLKKFFNDLIKLDFINDKERLRNSIEDFFNTSLGED